jgi:hypothetical protein
MSRRPSRPSTLRDSAKTKDWERWYREKLERKLERNIERYAYHEAGHAVFAYRSSFGLRSVQLEAIANPIGHGWNSLGRTQIGTGRDLQLYDTKRKVLAEEYLCMIMAGPIAESHYRGTRVAWHRLSGSDKTYIQQYSVIHCRMANSDDGCRQACIAYLRARTATWVDNWWPDIQKIARALVERRRLTGKQVADILTGISLTPPASEDIISSK